MGLLDLIKARQTLPTTTTTALTPSATRLPARREKSIPECPVDQLPAAARGKARERLKFVQLVQETAHVERIPLQRACAIVAHRHADSFPLLQVAGKNGISALHYNNYRNWAPLVAKGGSAAEIMRRLADGYRRGIQPSRGDDRFWQYLYASYLNENRLSSTVAYDVAVKRLRADDPEIVPPTMNQARYRLQQLDADIRTLGRCGETALRNKYIDYIVRDWSSIEPGDLVVGDNRMFDTRVKIFDEAKNRWIAVRPTICALIDARSWYMAAWEITPTPVNSWNIINTLAQYVGRYGAPPSRAYFDNGRDFCAQGFSTPLVVDGGYEHSIFGELGMALTNSIAFNARAKTVERVFRDQMQGFDKLFADYLGSNPGQRTMAATYFDQHPEELPTMDQFALAFTRWLETWHDTPKRGHIHKGETPSEIWERRPARRGLDEEQYRMAFAMPLGTRKVGRGPAVSIANVLYYCDALKVDDIVLVKRDHVAPDLIHVYTLDGGFLGFAMPRQAINALAEGAEEQGQLGDLIARQRRQIREIKTAHRALTGGMHVISAMELLEAPPDAKMLRMGSITSVKGSAHNYVRYALQSPTAPRLPAGTPPVASPADDSPVDAKLLALIHDARHPGLDDTQNDIDVQGTLARTPDHDDHDDGAEDFRALYSADNE